MNLGEIVRQSIDSLLRNRLRSGLTMLGIIWGLVTVVLLLSYGKSLGQGILNGFLGIGNKLFALPWSALTVDEAKKRFVVNVTKESLDRMGLQTAKNILSALDGKPIRENVINQEVLG